MANDGGLDCGCTSAVDCAKHRAGPYMPKPSKSEAALRKLLADVQEARACPGCVSSSGHGLCRGYFGSLAYLDRLAREGLGEP